MGSVGVMLKSKPDMSPDDFNCGYKTAGDSEQRESCGLTNEHPGHLHVLGAESPAYADLTSALRRRNRKRHRRFPRFPTQARWPLRWRAPRAQTTAPTVFVPAK